VKGGQVTVFQRRTVLKRHSQIFLATTCFSGDFFRFCFFLLFFLLLERKEGSGGGVGNKVTRQTKKEKKRTWRIISTVQFTSWRTRPSTVEKGGGCHLVEVDGEGCMMGEVVAG